tara:strand:+ start:511 stop:936 length:426 start_codon:yes stop_codon:yes gene_type:complete
MQISKWADDYLLKEARKVAIDEDIEDNYSINGFKTFLNSEYDSFDISRIVINIDDDYLGTNNFEVTIYGYAMDDDDTYDEIELDYEECISIQEVHKFIKHLGRDDKYINELLESVVINEKIINLVETTDEILNDLKGVNKL